MLCHCVMKMFQLISCKTPLWNKTMNRAQKAWALLNAKLRCNPGYLDSRGTRHNSRVVLPHHIHKWMRKQEVLLFLTLMMSLRLKQICLHNICQKSLNFFSWVDISVEKPFSLRSRRWWLYQWNSNKVGSQKFWVVQWKMKSSYNWLWSSDFYPCMYVYLWSMDFVIVWKYRV